MKIIQIAITAGGENNMTDNLYALTDTGKLFLLFDAGYSEVTASNWRELPELPDKEQP